MNKREKQEMENLKSALRLAKALRFTEDVQRDVPIPGPDEPFGVLSKGFDFAGERSDWPRVEKACSSRVGHGFGSDTETTSQRPLTLYSSRLLACRALRRAVEDDCAKRLARIDEMIEQELNGDAKND